MNRVIHMMTILDPRNSTKLWIDIGEVFFTYDKFLAVDAKGLGYKLLPLEGETTHSLVMEKYLMKPKESLSDKDLPSSTSDAPMAANSSKDIKKILDSVCIEAGDDWLNKVIRELNEQNNEDVIGQGVGKLAHVSAGPPKQPLKGIATKELGKKTRCNKKFNQRVASGRGVCVRNLCCIPLPIAMATYKLVLIRHRESAWSLQNCFWYDADLSPAGHDEAKR
ncbi:hypothetical protein U0070_002106 [Myodes glareolus]|uniref:Uncharacterized protein n=1 Tax=Myodes glareolus TaxID=447135 RepID=A0AAW0HP63_MYOGA